MLKKKQTTKKILTLNRETLTELEETKSLDVISGRLRGSDRTGITCCP